MIERLEKPLEVIAKYGYCWDGGIWQLTLKNWCFERSCECFSTNTWTFQFDNTLSSLKVVYQNKPKAKQTLKTRVAP